MLVFFSEFLTTKVTFIFLAIALMTLAALLFSTRESDTKPLEKTGILHALVAALFYGISSLLSKSLSDDGVVFAQQIYQSLFVIISSALYTLIKYRTLKIDVPNIKKEITLPFIGGVLFFCNSTSLVLAYSRIEGSIVSMLHQLNAIWLLVIGIFAFKEINIKKHWSRLVCGLILSVVGVFMLIWAKM